ncbi:MAG TPA: hypothetical protein VJZ73_05290 [Methylomirabilota bacterium]|nr:hypothetical protein [Methylomirabilota bacterium]
MSAVEAPLTVVSALAAVEKHVGGHAEWRATTETQGAFLHNVYAPCRAEVERIPEIESCGSSNVEDLNDFAARRGLAVSFRPLQADEAAAVSVLDLLVTWTEPGRSSPVFTRDRHHFPGVRLPASQVTFRRAACHPAPIAIISTVTGDTVSLTPLESAGRDLVALARRLTGDSEPGERFAGVVFPMVDLEVKQDLGIVIGLATRAADGRSVQIVAAEQHSSLKMNESGARAEVIVTMQMVLGIRRQAPLDFVINEPFLVWIERPGLSAPLFVAHVTREAWRNPGDLAARLSRPGPA